jgi:hypothetical protein
MPPTPTATPIPFGRLLRLGTTGQDVKGVKRALARELGVNDPPLGTSRLGPTAVGHIKMFQARHALEPDGVYGPKTHARLSHWFDDWTYLLYVGKPPPTTEKVRLPFPYTGTHKTSGLGWPGLDAIDVFARGGTRVLAPLAGVLRWTHMIPWNQRARVGGLTTYLEAAEGTFFLTHFDEALPSGTVVAKGQDIGSVGVVPHGWWEPHIHMGFKAAV